MKQFKFKFKFINSVPVLLALSKLGTSVKAFLVPTSLVSALVLISGFAGFGPIGATQQAFASSAVFKPMTLDEAKALAKKDGKLVLIDFTASWCGPCHRMDANTWSDPVVQKWVGENAIAIQLDVDKDTKASEEFKIRAMPSVVVFAPKDYAKEFDRHVGYLATADLMEWMEAVKRGESQLDLLRHAVTKVAGKGGETEVKARLKLGHALMEDEANYAEAGDQYLWLWQHLATEIPEAASERITVLPAEIGTITSKSESARKKFAELRDQAEKDKKTLDFVVLNEALHDQKRSLEWFDRVKKDPAEKDKVQEVNVILERVLITHGRWADLIFLYPNAIAELKGRLKLAEYVREELRKRGIKDPRDPFPRDAAVIYAGLLAAHKEADAKKFATEAFKLRTGEKESAAIRQAFVRLATQAKQARTYQKKWVPDDAELIKRIDEDLASAKTKKK